jgi:hypothetical protein
LDYLKKHEQNFWDIFNKNENGKNICINYFEEEKSFLDNFKKIENEKSISQDTLEKEKENLRNNFDKKENGKVISDNFNKDENGKNFKNDKSNDNNEINKLFKLLSNYSFIFITNDKREDFSPKLVLDFSEGESKNDKVKENSNLFNEEIQQIYENIVIKDKSIIRMKIKKKRKIKIGIKDI